MISSNNWHGNNFFAAFQSFNVRKTKPKGQYRGFLAQRLVVWPSIRLLKKDLYDQKSVSTYIVFSNCGQNGKLDKLSERQDTALWSNSDSFVVAMDACDLPNIEIAQATLFKSKIRLIWMTSFKTICTHRQQQSWDSFNSASNKKLGSKLIWC